jgi:curved DNA-binding protein CbpA
VSGAQPDRDVDLYAILEVHPRARIEVIEAAFAVLREIALRDDGPESARMLVRLNRAHHVLGHPERRAEYDAGIE